MRIKSVRPDMAAWQRWVASAIGAGVVLLATWPFLAPATGALATLPQPHASLLLALFGLTFLSLGVIGPGTGWAGAELAGEVLVLTERRGFSSARIEIPLGAVADLHLLAALEKTEDMNRTTSNAAVPTRKIQYQAVLRLHNGSSLLLLDTQSRAKMSALVAEVADALGCAVVDDTETCLQLVGRPAEARLQLARPASRTRTPAELKQSAVPLQPDTAAAPGERTVTFSLRRPLFPTLMLCLVWAMMAVGLHLTGWAHPEYRQAHPVVVTLVMAVLVLFLVATPLTLARSLWGRIVVRLSSRALSFEERYPAPFPAFMKRVDSIPLVGPLRVRVCAPPEIAWDMRDLIASVNSAGAGELMGMLMNPDSAQAKLFKQAVARTGSLVVEGREACLALRTEDLPITTLLALQGWLQPQLPGDVEP